MGPNIFSVYCLVVSNAEVTFCKSVYVSPYSFRAISIASSLERGKTRQNTKIEKPMLVCANEESVGVDNKNIQIKIIKRECVLE